MQKEEIFFNMEDVFNFEIPEFNNPSTTIKAETSESNNFLDSMEWENFANNNNNQNNDSLFLENLFSTEGTNIFGEENSTIANNDDQQMMNTEITHIKQETQEDSISPKFKEEELDEDEEEEEIVLEKLPQNKKTKTENNTAPKKKSKKQMTPEELEEKKKQQLEKRLIKNRRTAEISRKRKKAKKFTLEESLQQLTEQAKMLEKQSIEVACENRVLKTEYYALLSLILNIPALAKKFDKISEIVVDQKDNKIFMDPSGQIASVYLFNIIYSIHQQWIQMKQTINNQTVNQIQNPPSSLQDVIVN